MSDPTTNLTSEKPCDCREHPAMHDASGVCVNWAYHAGVHGLEPGQPCQHVAYVTIGGVHIDAAVLAALGRQFVEAFDADDRAGFNNAAHALARTLHTGAATSARRPVS